MTNSITLETVLDLAKQLSPMDQIRLIEQIAPQIGKALDSTPESPKAPLRDLWGLCADLGPAPSAEEIDAMRREAWADFPREDI